MTLTVLCLISEAISDQANCFPPDFLYYCILLTPYPTCCICKYMFHPSKRLWFTIIHTWCDSDQALRMNSCKANLHFTKYLHKSKILFFLYVFSYIFKCTYLLVVLQDYGNMLKEDSIQINCDVEKRNS